MIAKNVREVIYKLPLDLQMDSACCSWTKIEMSQVLELLALALINLNKITLPCKVVAEVKFKIDPCRNSLLKLSSDNNLSSNIVTVALILCFPRAGIVSPSIGASATTSPL